VLVDILFLRIVNAHECLYGLNSALTCGVLVDILFLRIVNAHECLYGLNSALAISNQVVVDFARRQTVHEFPMEPREMYDFPVRPTHGA
jgi:hypothetical protein